MYTYPVWGVAWKQLWGLSVPHCQNFYPYSLERPCEEPLALPVLRWTDLPKDAAESADCDIVGWAKPTSNVGAPHCTWCTWMLSPPGVKKSVALHCFSGDHGLHWSFRGSTLLKITASFFASKTDMRSTNFTIAVSVQEDKMRTNSLDDDLPLNFGIVKTCFPAPHMSSKTKGSQGWNLRFCWGPQYPSSSFIGFDLLPRFCPWFRPRPTQFSLRNLRHRRWFLRFWRRSFETFRRRQRQISERLVRDPACAMESLWSFLRIGEKKCQEKQDKTR